MCIQAPIRPQLARALEENVLLGELVNVRAIEREDASLVHRWLNDPVVMRGWGWSAPAVSRQEVAAQIEAWLAQEAAQGRPAALVAESLVGDAVGLIALRVDRPEARSVELSLLVGDPARWGQGLGADMLRTTLDACFDGWGIHRVGVRVEAGNERALGLYRRCGFREEGRLRQAAYLDGQHADIVLLALLAPEWETPRASSADDVSGCSGETLPSHRLEDHALT
jgi:RimJ/RimL family protein N-acetyltransferase